ncbi:MAG: C10 family peptidase [Lentimicrobium sp.]|nr:C10 family peptidase [Lentimicrobium sp.]
MKKSFLLLIFSLIASTSWSQSISKTDAENLAVRFLSGRQEIHNSNAKEFLHISGYQLIQKNGKITAYVFNFAGGGYIIVSASKYTFPILGYSLNGAFGEGSIPENLSAWLRYYIRQVQYAEEQQKADPEIEAARLKLHDGITFSGKRRVVEPLLKTTWDQGNPYNGMCPPDPGGPGGRCYAGCVATAVGQLMFYHRWPNQGTGEYSYTHPAYGEQYANYGETTYNWNGMETWLSGPNNHVALLLYHLGVSFDMDYGPNGSGMWNHSAANSIRTFFKYGPQTQYIFRDTTTMNWDSILIANLDARKPLYYAGWEGVGSQNGHAFVCDGYAPDNFYHFNWGWSSSYDGYFLLSALTPGGNNFNFAQEVIKDIYPDTTLYNYPQYCQEIDTLWTVSGTFSDGSNMVNYPAGADCHWLIQPNEPDYDSISAIRISFPLLDLAENDVLRIYQGFDTNGPLLAELTGNVPPGVIEIPSGNAFVWLSGQTGDANGFLASYKSVLPVYCSGTTTFNDASGTLEDGSGDKNYTNNSLCKWRIIPQNLVPLTLTFESFDVESGSDFLKIYDLGTQQLIATLSGNDLPEPITITSGKAYLIFNTNGQGTAQGWKLNWAPAGSVGMELQEKLQGKIYPNPVREELWINSGFISGSSVEAEVYTASGKLVRKMEMPPTRIGNNAMIDIRLLDKGLYLLKVISSEGTEIYRFVKL